MLIRTFIMLSNLFIQTIYIIELSIKSIHSELNISNYVYYITIFDVVF